MARNRGGAAMALIDLLALALLSASVALAATGARPPARRQRRR
jgi:hypothetical protein